MEITLDPITDWLNAIESRVLVFQGGDAVTIRCFTPQQREVVDPLWQQPEFTAVGNNLMAALLDLSLKMQAATAAPKTS